MPTPAEVLAAKKAKAGPPRGVGRPMWSCTAYQLRTSLGLSARDVAKEVGTSAQTLLNIEGGLDPKLSIAVAMAAFYGKPIEKLWPNRLPESK